MVKRKSKKRSKTSKRFNNNNLMIVGLVLLGLLFTMTGGGLQFAGGADFITCQEEEILTTNAYFDEPVLHCVASVSGGAQRAKVKIGDAGYYVDVNLAQQFCNHKISADSRQLSTFSQTSEESPNCGWICNYYVGKIVETPKYQLGTIPFSAESVTWSVTTDLVGPNGTVDSGVLTKEGLTTYSTNRSMYLKWIGDLGSIQQCSNTYRYAIRSVSGGRWSIVTNSKVDEYFGHYYTIQPRTTRSVNCYRGSINGNLAPVWEAFAPWGAAQRANAALDAITTTGAGSGYYQTTPAYPVVAPLISIYIPMAQLEGIAIPNGQPEIVSVTSDTIIANTPTNIEVEFKGTIEDDTYDFAFDCVDDEITLTANRLALEADETGVGILTVNGLEGNQTCTLTVHSVSNPDSKDVVEVEIMIEKLPCENECCEPDTIYKTKSCADEIVCMKEGETIVNATVEINVCENFHCVESTPIYLFDSGQISGDLSGIPNFEMPPWADGDFDLEELCEGQEYESSGEGSSEPVGYEDEEDDDDEGGVISDYPLGESEPTIKPITVTSHKNEDFDFDFTSLMIPIVIALGGIGFFFYGKKAKWFK